MDLTKPHAVYRIFDATGNLLYVGCSLAPFGRGEHHRCTQPWRNDIARIDVEWCDDWLAGRRREQHVIAAEHPRYNRLVFDPSAVGTTLGAAPDRGDGLTCPLCGQPKEQRKHTYCRPCTAIYQRERRVARGWVPKVRVPNLICPKCHGPKPAGKAYCLPCKRRISKDARDRAQLPH